MRVGRRDVDDTVAPDEPDHDRFLRHPLDLEDRRDLEPAGQGVVGDVEHQVGPVVRPERPDLLMATDEGHVEARNLVEQRPQLPALEAQQIDPRELGGPRRRHGALVEHEQIPQRVDLGPAELVRPLGRQGVPGQAAVDPTRLPRPHQARQERGGSGPERTRPVAGQRQFDGQRRGGRGGSRRRVRVEQRPQRVLPAVVARGLTAGDDARGGQRQRGHVLAVAPDGAGARAAVEREALPSVGREEGLGTVRVRAAAADRPDEDVVVAVPLRREDRAGERVPRTLGVRGAPDHAADLGGIQVGHDGGVSHGSSRAVSGQSVTRLRRRPHAVGST